MACLGMREKFMRIKAFNDLDFKLKDSSGTCISCLPFPFLSPFPFPLSAVFVSLAKRTN